ncbi:hypothetical protein ABPG75_004112 [Micractinium tetrahymenae]
MSQQPAEQLPEAGEEQITSSGGSEELRQRAAAANAVLDKGLRELQDLEGTKSLGVASSLAAELAPRDADGEAHTRTASTALGPGATQLVKGKVEVDYAG